MAPVDSLLTLARDIDDTCRLTGEFTLRNCSAAGARWVPIATMVSALTGTPALFVRKQAKAYGTCRLAEGADVSGRTVVLIEDVITTGGAVRAAAVALRERGAW
jgi:orotate phosphoribosyltransferase